MCSHPLDRVYDGADYSYVTPGVTSESTLPRGKGECFKGIYIKTSVGSLLWKPTRCEAVGRTQKQQKPAPLRNPREKQKSKYRILMCIYRI